MRIKITKQYILLLDDSANKEDGKPYLYNEEPEVRYFNIQYNRSGLSSPTNIPIVAYFPLLESSKLNLPLLPNPYPIIDIEKIAKESFPLPIKLNKRGVPYNSLKNPLKGFKRYKKAFEDGYKAALTVPKEFIPEVNCPFEFTSRCTLGRCSCELKTVDKNGVKELVGTYKY